MKPYLIPLVGGGHQDVIDVRPGPYCPNHHRNMKYKAMCPACPLRKYLTDEEHVSAPL